MQNNTESSLNLKNSNQLLIQVMESNGFNLYKSGIETKIQINEYRHKINNYLKLEFGYSLKEFDSKSHKEQNRIWDDVMNKFSANELYSKKFLPLGQVVAYLEFLLGYSYQELNILIDSTIKDCYKRIQIVNIFKSVNQDNSLDNINKDLRTVLGDDYNQKIVENWIIKFTEINQQIQSLYLDHVEFMDFNEVIRDLTVKNIVKNDKHLDFLFSNKHSWKPTFLENEIKTQSSNANRSVIEIISNGADSKTSEISNNLKVVNIKTNEKGYTIIDSGMGMNPFIILEKLLVPKISGKSGTDTIGRFGMGFYTILAHLENETDFVKIKTNDGINSWLVEFRIHERSGDIFLHTEKLNENIAQGTIVELNCEKFDEENCTELIQKTFNNNSFAKIIVNGGIINDLQKKEIIDFTDTSQRIIFDPDPSTKSVISVNIHGVLIQEIEIEGNSNLSASLCLDFPLDCSLPESRSDLKIDKIARNYIKKFIDKLLALNISDEIKIRLSNTLLPLVKVFQKNNIRKDVSSNLEEYFKNQFSIKFSGKYQFLPNLPSFCNLKIKNCIYADPALTTKAYESIDGIELCQEWLPNQGSTLQKIYLTDFHEDTEPIILLEDVAFIKKSKYEKIKRNPIILNLYFRKLNAGDSQGSEISGFFQINDHNIIEETKENEIELDPAILKLIPIIYNNDHTKALKNLPKGCNSIKKLLIDKLKSTLVSSEEAVQTQYDTGYYMRKLNILIHVLKILNENGNFENQIVEINKQFNIYALDDLLSALVEYFNTERKFINTDILNHIQFFMSFIGKSYKTGYTEYDYDKRNIFNRDLSIIVDFVEAGYIDELLISKLKEYDEDVVVLYITMINCLNKRDLMEDKRDLREDKKNKTMVSKEIFEKLNTLFFEKMVNTDSVQISKLSQLLHSEFRVNNDLKNINYNKINKEIRGIVIYLIEGGEILPERRLNDNPTISEKYSLNVSLSELITTKRCSEKQISLFQGSLDQLGDLIRQSNNGVDATKAIRDITHAASSQIVNNEYLWIREVLQNSVDISIQYQLANQNDTTNPPKVKVGVFKESLDFQDYLVVETFDTIGMDLNKIINYLLIPGESDKRGDETTVGEKGQGFFTILQNSKFVSIKTSLGDGKTNYIKIRPFVDLSDNIIDYVVEFEIKEEYFKGTYVQKTIDTSLPEVEASMVKSSVISYGSLVDSNKANITFQNKQVNKPKNVLSQIEIPGCGKIEIYEANENSMTQNGLFIKELDNDILDMIPPSIKLKLLSHGIVIDIPPKIKLINSRADIARKEVILPLIKNYIPKLVFQTYLKLVMSNKINLDNIPYDFFEYNTYGETRRSFSSDIIDDVNSISKGQEINYQKYFNDKDALFKLLINLPIGLDNKSYVQIVESSMKNDTLPDKVDLSDHISKSIKESKAKLAVDQKSKNIAKSVYKSNTQVLFNHYRLSDLNFSKENDVYHAFDYVFSEVLSAIGSNNVSRKYSFIVEQARGYADKGGNIFINLYTTGCLFDLLKTIIANRLSIESPITQKFFIDTMELITHERVHNIEQFNGLTHNDVFFETQRKLTLKLIDFDYQKVLKRLYSFNPEFQTYNDYLGIVG